MKAGWALGKAAARIDRERRTIRAMVGIFCRGTHGRQPALCPDCQSLLEYAERRLDNCPFESSKPACKDCRVHCYGAVMRERVKAAMRYAGPRMLLHHPWLALRHRLDERRPIPELPQKKSQRANPTEAPASADAQS